MMCDDVMMTSFTGGGGGGALPHSTLHGTESR